MPTAAGFLDFARNVMGIDPVYLPDDAPIIGVAFRIASGTVNPMLRSMPDMYDLAVYNLAGDTLINFAPDQTDRTYFRDLRKALDISAFVPGVIGSSGDAATSESLVSPDWVRGLTMGDLQRLKTDWGRRYIGIAQSVGTLWGLS